MDTFKTLYPSPILSPYIKQYWNLKTDDALFAPERIIPSGSITLTFHLDNVLKSLKTSQMQPQYMLSGMTSDYFELVSVGSVNMICVVFQPFSARLFFNFPMDKAKNQIISVDELENTALKELSEKVVESNDFRKAVCLIENYLLNQLRISKEYNFKRMNSAVQMINSVSNVNTSLLSETVNLSYKQFNRVFSEYIGMNPKEFIRVVRFQRALYLMQNNPNISFSQLAFDCGYYDQSHFINEFKTFSGLTPMEYLAACQPFSDYFTT